MSIVITLFHRTDKKVSFLQKYSLQKIMPKYFIFTFIILIACNYSNGKKVKSLECQQDFECCKIEQVNLNDNEEFFCQELINGASKNVQTGDDMVLIANPKLKDMGVSRCYWHTPKDVECQFMQGNSFGDAFRRVARGGQHPDQDAGSAGLAHRLGQRQQVNAR